MPEWWTYRLTDFLMFEPETYYRLFVLYNRAVWPAQLVALALGLGLLGLALRGGVGLRRWAPPLLAAAWLWVAWSFFWRRYAPIFLAAGWFGWSFVAEAVLLAGLAMRPGRWPLAVSQWREQETGTDRLARSLMVFGLAVQPLLGPIFGRSWGGMEWFGLAPDPTVSVTLGLLLALSAPRLSYVVPLLWCALTGLTLWAMNAPDAWVMPLAALVVLGRGAWRILAGARRTRGRVASPGA